MKYLINQIPDIIYIKDNIIEDVVYYEIYLTNASSFFDKILSEKNFNYICSRKINYKEPEVIGLKIQNTLEQFYCKDYGYLLNINDLNSIVEKIIYNYIFEKDFDIEKYIEINYERLQENIKNPKNYRNLIDFPENEDERKKILVEKINKSITLLNEIENFRDEEEKKHELLKLIEKIDSMDKKKNGFMNFLNSFAEGKFKIVNLDEI